MRKLVQALSRFQPLTLRQVRGKICYKIHFYYHLICIYFHFILNFLHIQYILCVIIYCDSEINVIIYYDF